MDVITKKILNKFSDPAMLEKLIDLSGAELNSLLLTLFKMRTDKISANNVLRAYDKNRFVKPSHLDPLAYHTLEADLLQIAKEQDIVRVLLSPATPFAGSAAFGYVNQNNVISALRGVEMLSDPTNMLSIIIADKLKRKKLQTNALCIIAQAHGC